jgi:hypothetical protein
MVDRGIDSGWQFPSLVDYYDFNQRVLVEQPERLEALDEEGRAAALSVVQRVVADQASALDDTLLSEGAVSVIDDLYKAGCAADVWGPLHADYVRAVWGTFFSVLSDRGFTIRYVVENTFGEPLDHPLILFPDLFRSAGVTYVCPHELATRLPEGATAEHTIDGLRFLGDEARYMARQIVDKIVATEHVHLAYLEIDFVEGCLDGIMDLRRAPGTISAFRNEAPLPGTNIQMSIEPKT